MGDGSLGFQVELGDDWENVWSGILDVLNRKCSLFEAMCPCPKGAEWCTSDPCRVVMPGPAFAGYNPAEEYSKKAREGGEFYMSTQDIRDTLDLQDDWKTGDAHDPETLASYAVQKQMDTFLYRLEGRRAILRSLRKEANTSTPICNRAIFMYRLWGKLAAGMNNMYSGLAELCPAYRPDSSSCSWTYSMDGIRGANEMWSPQGRLKEDYNAAILTWPEAVLHDDCLNNAVDAKQNGDKCPRQNPQSQATRQ